MSLSEVDAFMAALKEGYTLILPLVAEVGTELKSICECASAERGEVLFYDLVCSSAVDTGSFRGDTPQITAERWKATREKVLQTMAKQREAYMAAVNAGNVQSECAQYKNFLGLLKAINQLWLDYTKPAISSGVTRKHLVAWGSPAQLKRRVQVAGGMMATPQVP